MGVIIMWT